MDLITRTAWGARRPKYRNTGSLTAKSTCHYNGPDIVIGGKKTWDHSKCAGLVRGIQNFHMDGRGWSDIAYNFIICPHGYTFEGRGINVINGANGTNAGNRTSHAIMCLAGEGNTFTDLEKVEFRQCVGHVVNQARAQTGCIGHRDHKSTACPGDIRYRWVRSGMPVPGTTAPKPPPAPNFPPFKPNEGQFSLYPWNKNKATIKNGAKGDLVRYLQGVIKFKAGGGIVVDGDFGDKTEARVKDIQRTFKLVADGIVGPKTWGAIDYLAFFK